MKVLQINSVYKKGSTGKIVAEIHSELERRGLESIVCYGRAGETATNVYKSCKEYEANLHTLIIRTGLILNYGGLLLPTGRLIGIIKRENPDVVHLHCLNGSMVNIYRLLKWLAKSGIKVVVTHHAEFYYTGSCEHAYDCSQFMTNVGCQHCPIIFRATRSKTFDNSNRAWRNMRDAFAGFDRNNICFTSVSPWLKERSQLSPIVNRFRCEVVLNGVDIKTFNQTKEENIIRKRTGNIYKRICLFVGAYFNPTVKEDNKGGWYIYQLANKMPNTLFVVVSLRMDNVGNTPPNVLLWGASKGQQELASLYRSSDVTIVTSRRETFSMVTAESLCCGTPVVGFKAGGPESVAIKDYSHFVNYGDTDALYEVIKDMLAKEKNSEFISCRAQEMYSSIRMTDNYIKIYEQLFKRKKQCI